MAKRAVMGIVLFMLAGCGSSEVEPGDGIVPNAKWYTGLGEPDANVGVNGDLYLDTKDSIVYVKTGGDWLDVADLRGPEGPEGPPGPGIEYWIHTITDEEVTYVEADPSGYYEVYYEDDRLGATDWVDVWTVSDNGAWFRLAAYQSDNLDVWYYVIYTYEGAIGYNSPTDEVGQQLVVFRAPTTLSSDTAKSSGRFNAAEHFRDLANRKVLGVE